MVNTQKNASWFLPYSSREQEGSHCTLFSSWKLYIEPSTCLSKAKANIGMLPLFPTALVLCPKHLQISLFWMSLEQLSSFYFPIVVLKMTRQGARDMLCERPSLGWWNMALPITPGREPIKPILFLLIYMYAIAYVLWWLLINANH